MKEEIKRLEKTQLKEVLNELGVNDEDAIKFASNFILDEISYYDLSFSSTKEDVLRHLGQIEITIDCSDEDIKSMKLIRDVLFSSELERHKKYTEMIVSDC